MSSLSIKVSIAPSSSFLLKSNKPREGQKTLHLSTPSLATYHLSKLEETGLVRKEKGELIVNKVIFEDCMRFRRFLIQRYLFYSVFAVLALIIEGHFFQAHCNYELILLLCNCNSCLCVDLLF
jgi:hypothetical protein